MICCLNPACSHPLNPDDVEQCRCCGAKLTPLLRDHYRPIKPIGQGGFGRTYVALDTDRLNTYCVVKQFAPQTQGAKPLNKAIQLFNQEALRLHELGEHPQIPTLLAYFEQDQYLYLVQQRIEGKTLAQEIHQQGPFDEAGIRALLHDLLPVLQFIHDHKVIHRDITPSNLIRRKVDKKPVLIDFGVAKQFRDNALQPPGTRIGTEGYAPIEQLRSGQVYPSSDLYSLGATCLHLLTGYKPERLYNPLEGRWMWRERLQKRGVSVSPQLGAILDCLVKDLISERYRSASEALSDLQALPALEEADPDWVKRPPTDRQSAASPIDRVDRVSSQPMGQSPGFRPSRPPLSSPQPSTSKRPISIPPATGSRDAIWSCAQTLTGHNSWVMSTAFNPKTPTVVSGSLDDSIRVWNIQTGAQLYTLTGHSRGVNTVVVSPTGQILASCSDDDTVKVWDLSEGALLYTLKGHTRDVNAIAIGSSGLLLASGGEDRAIKLWKLDQGILLKTLIGAAGIIKSIVISPDEKLLISGGFDNQVRLWSLQQGKMIQALSGHFNSVNAVAISMDGQLIASAGKDKTIRIWNPATGELIRTLTDHFQEVNTVAIAADNQTVVSGSSDSTLKIWNIQTGELRYTLKGHIGSVTSVAIHRSGKLIASASTDKTVKIWQLR